MESNGALRHYKLLIVDDEPHVLETIIDVLEDADEEGQLEFLTASSGQEALDILANHHEEIDLVLTDQRMPGMSGAELLRQISEKYPTMGSIVISGFAEFEDMRSAFKSGIFDYIKKPYDEDHLVGVVRSALEKTELRRRNACLVDELQDANQNLEQRVNERTKELRDSLQRLRSMQQQLIQAEKMSSLGQLVAGIAHEINNPATSVYAGAEALESNVDELLVYVDRYKDLLKATRDGDGEEVEEIADELKDSEEDVDYLLEEGLPWSIRSMKEGAVRIKDIVRNLKTFSRVDEAEVKHADINEGIRTTLKLVHHELKNRINVHEEFGDIPQLECYPGQLNQVFMNILVNAAQAIEGEGDIWIKTSTENGALVVRIKDTGGGIPEDKLKDVFNPFFTTKPVGQGTGLGLSISYSIIKKHGGQIAIESEQGVGTEFIITLPFDGIQKAKEQAKDDKDSARSQYEFMDVARLEELERELAHIDENIKG
ncbi:MAG: response regulator [Candidatus Coatesbacteria bacterium]|nr:response regulator [Candidatus Coatesbacteria bacterium]